MQFNLVDRILEVQPGKRICAIKHLALGEEYLADHFPTFPVMPGVLMLQTLVEAGAWLLRIGTGFQHSVVALREVRNVKYGNFMDPGKTLKVTVDLQADGGTTDPQAAILKGKGECEGVATVSARFTLASYNLRDRDPPLQAVDEKIIAHFKAMYEVLRGRLDAVS
jgi:3-hydroxyacyl-[acyl-carrier-protein] dehydratase